MQSLTQIRAYLDEAGATPKKKFGQNFLHDQNQLRKLVEASGIGEGDVALEVGPGTGTLTEALLESGARVVACEIDDDMVGVLARHVAPHWPDRLTIVEGDALASKRSLNPAVVEALDASFRLVANLPYGAASPLVTTLLTAHHPSLPNDETTPRCVGLFVTVQKEVADRILATPGGKDYGPLTVICQALARVERVSVLPPSCFWPAPKVTSAMIALTPRDRIEIDPARLSRGLSMIFRSRRKQLKSLTPKSMTWPDGVLPTMRPEQLSVDQLVAICDQF
ncbi:MAG: 16S rRNA (adenine(1518)-N(6)/adenine(1519)-N(6))-dimethyltransferase RsmA [Phycisphaerales bacterium]